MDKVTIVSYKEFTNICRVCLSHNNLRYFQEVEDVMGIFRDITNIQIEELDELPQNICDECITKLESITNFINLSRQNDTLLRQIISKTAGIKSERDHDKSSIISNHITVPEIDIKDESEPANEIYTEEFNLCTSENTVSLCEQEESKKNCILSNCQLEINLTDQQVRQCRRKTVKKALCPFCHLEVTHFARHIFRHHKKENIVKQIQALPPLHPKRKTVLQAFRKEGNFFLHKKRNIIRPVRQKSVINGNEDYLACDFCLGFYSSLLISKHRIRCKFRKTEDIRSIKKENHWAKCQIHTLCSGLYKDFYNSLKITTEAFILMRNDAISKVAIKELLICSYGESQMSENVGVKIIVSGMRKLGQLLIELQKITGVNKLIDNLKPEYYNGLVVATKIISGYDMETQTYKDRNLALQMGIRLKSVCSIATKNILNTNPYFYFTNPKGTIEDIEQLKHLIHCYWNEDINKLEGGISKKRIFKPKLLILTKNIKVFYNHIILEANKAAENLNQNKNVHTSYKILSECILAFTILFNRKRIHVVEYILLSSYKENNLITEEKLLKSLTKSEKMQSQRFKKVISYGKNCKPFTILFPENIQEFINVLIRSRDKCVPKTNNFLFADPDTNIWLSGKDALKQLTNKDGVNNPDLFTSTEYREEVSTVLRVLTMTEDALVEFETLLGIPKKMNDYYRLVKNSYHIARITKMLLAVDKGLDIKSKIIEDATYFDIKSEMTTECLNGINLENESAENNTPDNETTIIKHIPKTRKKRWTEDQQLLIKTYFKESIDNKEAPKKDMIQHFISQYKDIFEDRNWVLIKAFVYNCYRNKEMSTLVERKKEILDYPAVKKKIRWTTEQKSIIMDHFKDFIKNKRAPKKMEVEHFVSKHVDIFKDRNWVVIKAFVYNCYKDK